MIDIIVSFNWIIKKLEILYTFFPYLIFPVNLAYKNKYNPSFSVWEHN